jgi:hypothetical protein
MDAPAAETTNTAGDGLRLRVVPIQAPEEINLILGQSHFIKTVEDLHEALVGAVPGIQFGLAFCEASGPALVRWSGTDDQLSALARETMREVKDRMGFLAPVTLAARASLPFRRGSSGFLCYRHDCSWTPQ